MSTIGPALCPVRELDYVGKVHISLRIDMNCGPDFATMEGESASLFEAFGWEDEAIFQSARALKNAGAGPEEIREALENTLKNLSKV